MGKLKRLMCRLIGHKDYATMGGVRCERCGRGNGNVLCFVNNEVLAAMNAQLDFIRDRKR
jgi:hypothetical protein